MSEAIMGMPGFEKAYPAEQAHDAHIGFKKLEHQIAKKGNVTDPAAVAASIGRKKYGQKEMTRRSVAGRK